VPFQNRRPFFPFFFWALLLSLVGGGSSSDCCGQTTFARELFHMSKRLVGVVSSSDISAVSSVSCPLGGVTVNPEQRGCSQRVRGEALLCNFYTRSWLYPCLQQSECHTLASSDISMRYYSFLPFLWFF